MCIKAVEGSDGELKQQFQWDVIRGDPPARGMPQELRWEKRGWWAMQGLSSMVVEMVALETEDPDELFAPSSDS